jgi:signal transduction histidine kinase
MLSPENKLTNIIATFRDITNFRKADEAKTTFISIVSHELKTPVALIKGYVCTLNRKDVEWDSAFVDESLKIIEEEADHLNELIENLLDATRLQTGKFSIQKTDISIPAIARRLIERFSTQTDKHSFKINFPEDFPSVLADDTRIEQVLSNLVSNAIKYSPKGEITIGGEVRPDKVIICVSDEGPGIAPQDLPFIFDRFYRSPDSARKTKGAGLGLYLTQQIIEAHKGRIWIDTERDKGARFCFSLPRNE